MNKNMPKQIFQTPAMIRSIRTLVDGGNKLDIETQELPPEEMTLLFNLKSKPGFFIFKEGEIKQEDLIDIPDTVAEFKGDKTPSQRLRAVLFILWQARGAKDEFRVFYERYTNQLIEKIKEQINA